MNRFKELRENRNISLEKLSSILKTNTSTLSRIENCQREPKQSTIENYANFFNVSIDYLLGFSDNPNVNNDKNILRSDFMSIFSDRLRISRETLTTYSQKEFAKKVNIAPNTYNGYETGNRMPNLQIVTLLADSIGVSVDYLLGRTDIRNIKNNNSLSKEELSLMDDYKKLNSAGKKEAEKRVKELTTMPFYREDETVTIVAHSNKPIDDEEMSKIHKDLEEMLKW